MTISSADADRDYLELVTRDTAVLMLNRTPQSLDYWMEAVLLLCVSLVQGAVSTLKMIFVPRARECHTEPTHDALPPATSSTHAPAFILQDEASELSNTHL